MPLSKTYTADPHGTARLDYSTAQSTPCAGCDAGCCIYLPLKDLAITDYKSLDYAFYVLNFANIELALFAGGLWRAHLVRACSKLDVETRKCTVHETPEQPQVCKRYDPYFCTYKKTFHSPDSESSIRFDTARLKVFASLCVFDGHRQIVEQPSMETLLATLPPLDLTRINQEPPAPDSPQKNNKQTRKQFSDFQDPCAACPAWCCSSLVFPTAAPSSVGSLDYYKFFLNFPGTALTLSNNEASLMIRADCQHLVRNEQGHGKCGVFGKAERPQVCRLYDEQTCGYKERFSAKESDRSITLSRSDFHKVQHLFEFDENGYLVHRPTLAEMNETRRTP